ncbi:MAG: 50S ribosomal protein L9 [Proteobacteria bacterium]|nr:50S ribosomal protein L9 [Pseudomonadota bacterium]
MQVILLERVPNLGKMGQTVNVKPGFARNFLLPRGKALPATDANLAKYEAMAAELTAQSAAEKAEAEKVAAKLQDASVTIERQASEVGQLYGSVKPSDIVKAMEAKGYDVPKGSVTLREPIKTVGEFNAKVTLHPEVIVTVPVNVTRYSN